VLIAVNKKTLEFTMKNFGFLSLFVALTFVQVGCGETTEAPTPVAPTEIAAPADMAAPAETPAETPAEFPAETPAPADEAAPAETPAP